MIYKIFLVTGVLWIAAVAYTCAQGVIAQLQEVQALVKKEGEVFMAIDRINPQTGKVCLEENSIVNQVQFTADSAFVNYINYTELFCEVYVLRTHYTYHFTWKDIDAAAIRLVEKKYTVGNGRLKEGKAGWFEVHLFTKDKTQAIVKRDRESKQTEQVSTVSLMVQEKESAKRIQQLLKTTLQEIQGLE